MVNSFLSQSVPGSARLPIANYCNCCHVAFISDPTMRESVTDVLTDACSTRNKRIAIEWI